MTYIFELTEYYCLCKNFLFNSGDVILKTRILNTQYIWTNSERNGHKLLYERIFLRPSNLLKCKKCFRGIGAVVYPYDEQKEKLRFNTNNIISRKMFMIRENEGFKMKEN